MEVTEKASQKSYHWEKVIQLLKRPQVTYDAIAKIHQAPPQLSDHALTQLEVQIKYEGYISKQQQQVARFKRLESKKLQEDLDYEQISGLRMEAREKLNKRKPVSLGQAARISGVSPADINVLLIHLEKKKRSRK